MSKLMSYTPTPQLLVVDIVIRRGTEYLFITRKYPPFKSRLALPGGYVEPDETVEQAAAREAEEETGVKIDPIQLELIGVWSDPARDPRGVVRSVAFFYDIPAKAKLKTKAKAGDDAVEVRWLDAKAASARKLAFDHNDIFARALGRFT
jgi:8-oxo-dGTP diphosphatase